MPVNNPIIDRAGALALIALVAFAIFISYVWPNMPSAGDGPIYIIATPAPALAPTSAPVIVNCN